MKQAHIVSAIASVLLLSGATFAFAQTDPANLIGTVTATATPNTTVGTGLTLEEKLKIEAAQKEAIRIDLLEREQRIQQEIKVQQAKAAGLMVTPNTTVKPNGGTTTASKQVLTPWVPLTKDAEALLRAQEELRQTQKKATLIGVASTTKDYALQRAQQNLEKAQEKVRQEDQKKEDNKATLACAGVAIEKREVSIQTAFMTFSASIQSALTTRQTGLKTAWSIESPTERRIAIKDVWTLYTKASKSAHEALRTGRNTAYSTFRADMKACKASPSNEEGGGFSSTITTL